MVETASCPSSVVLLHRQRPSAFLPPSRAALVSHFFSRDNNGVAVAAAVIVFRLVRPLLSYSRRVLSFVSSFMYDEETEQTSDRSGSISCVEQEER
jgi:hypothetical protein